MASESSIQSPASTVQSTASRVQSPASRVKRPTLASRVQEFRYAVKIWIRTITATAKIWQTITETSVIFIIRISVSQFHMYFYDSSTQFFRSVIVNSSCFMSLGSCLCTGASMFAHWPRQLIAVTPQRDESSRFLFTFLTR